MLQELRFVVYRLAGGPFDGQVQFLPEELPAGFTLVKAPRLTDAQCLAFAKSGFLEAPEAPSIRHAYRLTGGQTLAYQGGVVEAPAFCNGGGI